MRYFITGTAHFFNIFADFLEHCENIIYLLFVLIVIALIIFTLYKNNDFKFTLLDIIKYYFTLFKFVFFTFLCIILLFTSIIAFYINNQFKILSLLVIAIKFIKETVNAYDDKLFNKDSKYIFKKEDLKSILIPNLVLIFFKLTYWCELYIFDITQIINYCILMLIIIVSEIIVMILFKIYSIYTQIFILNHPKSNYPILYKIIDLIKILKLCSNKVNYFQLTRIFLQCEIITKQNKNELINLCLYYKSIENKITDNCFYMYEVYNDYITVNKRIGCDDNE